MDINKIAGFNSKSRTKNIKKNILTSFTIKFIGMLLSFLVIPLTIDYLNSERYGIWMTLLSILSWISFFDIGIGNGLRNKLTEALSKNDVKSAKEYISTAYASIITIVIIIFLVLVFIIPTLNWNSIFNTTALKNNEFISLVFIVIIFSLFNFILALSNQFFYAMQEAAVSGLGNLLLNIFLIVNICVLKRISNGSLIYLAISYGIATMSSGLIITFYFFVKHKGLSPNVKYVKSDKIKDIVGTGVKFFIIQLSSLVIFTTDNIIITQVLGPEYVTTYNLAQKLFSAIIMVHSIIVTPLWSAYTEAYIKKDVLWIKNLLKKLNYLMFPIILAVGLLVLLSEKIINIWIGSEIIFPKYLIVFMGVYTILNIWNNVYAYFLSGIGKVNCQMYVSIIAGTINIPLSIFFAKNIGLGNSGVILGTIVSLLFVSIIYPIEAFYVIKNMKDKNINM